MKGTMLGSAVMVIVSLVALAGCGGGGDVYGETPSDAALTPLASILTNPAAHDGQAVKVQGQIVRECPSGCWFDLQEGQAVVRVDIAPNGLAIPQRVGATAIVEGVVAVEDGQTMVVGSGVMLK